MTNLLKILHLTIIIVFSLVAYCYADRVALDIYKYIYGIILNVSAIIFGVMGAWVALLKNNIDIQIKLPSLSRVQRQQEVEKLSIMIWPMTASGLMVIACISFGYFSAISPEIDFLIKHKDTLKIISLFVFSVIAYIQIASLLRLVITGIQLLLDTQKTADSESADAQR